MGNFGVLGMWRALVLIYGCVGEQFWISEGKEDK